MLPGLNLPASLLRLLSELRPCFAAPGCATFSGPWPPACRAGCAAARWRACCWGGALQHLWPHDRAHYFLARARWELDELGLAVAQLAVTLLVPPGADLAVAVDDSVFRRGGRKVHGPAGSMTAAPRRWASSATATASSPPRSWLSCRSAPARCACQCWPGCTCRIPRNAVLHDLAPPRTGRRGRPRSKGDRLGTAADIAVTASWATVTVAACGRREQSPARRRDPLPVVRPWHTRAVRLILSRDEHTAR